MYLAENKEELLVHRRIEKKQAKSGEDAEKTNRCKLVGGGDLHKRFLPHLDNKSTNCSCDAPVS